MKKMKKMIRIVALALAIGLVLAACPSPTDGGGTGEGGSSNGGGAQTFTSIGNFNTWLSAQPANTAATAYNVKLNVSNLGGKAGDAGSAGNALYTNDTKYVSLDLSGSTITSIGEYAFEGCVSLTSVAIPASVTSIGWGAFMDCDNLASVVIPGSVTSIGGSAFSGCLSLAAITVDSGNAAYSSQDGVLYNKAKTTLVTYPAGKAGTAFTIPDSVISIGDGAFLCSSLASVTIPNSVTSIGDRAFGWCDLISVTIPASVTSIG